MGTRTWAEEPALIRFCETMFPRLLGALVLQTGDRALAEDLAQETLCRVCEKWDSVGVMERPEGWAFTVAFNLARSWWRRVAAGRRAQNRLVPPTDDGTTTDELGERQWVRDAVAALPPRQRQVVVLRFYAELSVTETAVVMGCAPGTVKSLGSKARAALARHLDPAEVVDDGRARSVTSATAGTVAP